MEQNFQLIYKALPESKFSGVLNRFPVQKLLPYYGASIHIVEAKTIYSEVRYYTLFTSTGFAVENYNYIDMKQDIDKMVDDINYQTKVYHRFFDFDNLVIKNRYLGRKLWANLDKNAWVTATKYKAELAKRERQRKIEAECRERKEKSNAEFFRTFEGGIWSDEALGITRKTNSYGTRSKMSLSDRLEKLSKLF